jgi:hypothetical protein
MTALQGVQAVILLHFGLWSGAGWAIVEPQ